MKNIKANGPKTTKTPAKAAAMTAPKRTVEPAPAKAPATKKPASRNEITSDVIATRAYIIWEQQGRPQGRDVAHWLLAESQLKNEHSFTA